MNSQRILINKEKDLEFKELLISKLNNASDNIDLIDELIRIKLGYSADDEIVLSIE
jgi:cell division protein FtsB